MNRGAGGGAGSGCEREEGRRGKNISPPMESASNAMCAGVNQSGTPAQLQSLTPSGIPGQPVVEAV